jgi:hypothetical protein
MKRFLVIALLLLPTVFLIIMIVAHKHGADNHIMTREQQIYYAKQLLDQWNTNSYTSIGSSQFQPAISNAINSKCKFLAADTIKAAKYEESIGDFLNAYSSGSFDAYLRFRLPPGVVFNWHTNIYGRLDDFLQSGPRFGDAKMLDRWESGYDVEAKTIKKTNTEDVFRFYVKFYSAGNFFKDYWKGVCLSEAEFIAVDYTNSPPPLWEVKFKPFSVYKGFSADATFPNLGYASQKINTYICYNESMENVLQNDRHVLIVDAFLYIQPSDAGNVIPVLIRYYWVPSLDRWLVDDLVIANLRYMNSRFPVF